MYINSLAVMFYRHTLEA